MTTSIPSPGQAMSDVNSQIICEAAIELPVRELVDAIIQAGWQPMVVYAAMKVVAERQGNAYTEDPDPRRSRAGPSTIPSFAGSLLIGVLL